MDILLRLRVSIMKMNCELLSLAVFLRKFDNDSQYLTLTTRNLATFVNTYIICITVLFLDNLDLSFSVFLPFRL